MWGRRSERRLRILLTVLNVSISIDQGRWPLFVERGVVGCAAYCEGEWDGEGPVASGRVRSRVMVANDLANFQTRWLV